MTREKLTVGAAVALAGVLIGALLWSTRERDARDDLAVGDPAPASAERGEPRRDLEAQLAAKDARIGELEGELSELREQVEALLAAERRPAAVVEGADVLTDRGEEAVVDAGVPAPRPASSAAEWLQTVLPDRYGELTPEEFAQLIELNLRGAVMTDADLAHLSEFPQLQSLSLRGAAITDEGVYHLRALGQLSYLELRGTALTGEALRHLPTWSLEALHLTDTHVAGEDVFNLPPIPKLDVLKLNRLTFGDEHVAALSRYPTLRHLELDQTTISDVGLARLLELNPGLRRIELRSTHVTSDGVRALQERYPDCEFILDSGIPHLSHR